jgi:hypothetical protein
VLCHLSELLLLRCGSAIVSSIPYTIQHVIDKGEVSAVLKPTMQLVSWSSGRSFSKSIRSPHRQC